MKVLNLHLILFVCLAVKQTVWSLTIKGRNVNITNLLKGNERFMTCTNKIEEGNQKVFDCDESLNGRGDLNAYDEVVSKKDISFTQVEEMTFKDLMVDVSGNFDVDFDRTGEWYESFTLTGKSVVTVGKDLYALKIGILDFKVLDSSELSVSGSAFFSSLNKTSFTLDSFAQFNEGFTIVGEFVTTEVRIGKGAKLYANGFFDAGNGFYSSFTMADKTSLVSVKNGNMTINAISSPVILGTVCVEGTLKIRYRGKFDEYNDLKVHEDAKVTVRSIAFEDWDGRWPASMQVIKVPEAITVDKNLVCDSPPHVPFQRSTDL